MTQIATEQEWVNASEELPECREVPGIPELQSKVVEIDCEFGLRDAILENDGDPVLHWILVGGGVAIHVRRWRTKVS